MLQARTVSGSWRTLRWWADAILIAILLGIPWIRIAGEPLVLLDIPERRFHVFGLVIFPQELYFLWLIVAALGLSLFLFTALAGRVWCGWACPQTVFTDVYAALARRIQGWRGWSAPTHVPAWRRAATHVCWFALSAGVAFHLVGYFVSPYELVDRFRSGQLGGAAIGFLGVISVVTYLDFAIVRQTFCKYLCPYARFQGVLFDRDTLVVGYDAARGEPRGKRGAAAGDCVDCGLCVQVCPTAIDIRDGLQLECIACTQCIDACNGVMSALERPANLIGYRSWVGLEGLRRARLIRPRVVVYAAMLLAVAAIFTTQIVSRVPMGFAVAHNRDALFGRMADGRIANAFTLHLENRDRAPRSFRIRLQAEPGESPFELVAGVNPVPVAPIDAVEARVFVMAPAGWSGSDGPAELRFVLEDAERPGRQVVQRARFLGPGGKR